MTLIANHPSQQLIDLVGTLGGQWHGRVALCRCPAHADRTPSLTLRQGDCAILVTCFAGCRREDILRELGRVRVDGRYPYVALPCDTAANVYRLWDAAGPVRGTIGEAYLSRRRLGSDINDVRFLAACPWRAVAAYARPDVQIELVPPPAGLKDWAEVLETPGSGRCAQSAARPAAARRDYAMLLLMITYGLRAREVAALREAAPMTSSSSCRPSWGMSIPLRPRFISRSPPISIDDHRRRRQAQCS